MAHEIAEPEKLRGRFGRLEVIEARGELRLAGKKLRYVNARVVEILCLLIRKRDEELVTYETMLDSIWPDDKNLHDIKKLIRGRSQTCVKKLNRAIRQDGDSKPEIANYYDKGYRFVGDWVPCKPCGERRIVRVRRSVAKKEFLERDDVTKPIINAWYDTSTHIFVLPGIAGIGKTTLLERTYQKICADQECGPQLAWHYSFNSQGADKRRADSSDNFFRSAYQFFFPGKICRRIKEEEVDQLAQLLKQHRSLIWLDGIDPQLNPSTDRNEGHLKNRLLSIFLKELADENPGLCMISTRYPVKDLEDYDKVLTANPLPPLSVREGANLLKKLNIEGTLEARKQTSKDLHGHPFLLKLTATYLRERFHGNLAERHRVAVFDLSLEGSEIAEIAEVAIQSWIDWFQDEPAAQMINLLGLFRGPASPAMLETLYDPPIPELSDRLYGMRRAARRQLVKRLRKTGLLAAACSESPDALDAHPLVRAYAEKRLSEQNREAWKAGNARLFEYCLNDVSEQPETMEEMSKLYDAVSYGCRAGMHHEAMWEVYIGRIQQSYHCYSLKTFGDMYREMAATWCLYDECSRQPSEMKEPYSPYVVAGWLGLLHGIDCRPATGIAHLRPYFEDSQYDAMNHSFHSIAKPFAARVLTHSYALLGKFSEAAICAKQMVKLMDESVLTSGEYALSPVSPVTSRFSYGHILHQQGSREAADQFAEAFVIKEKIDTLGKPLNWLWALWYGEFLLDHDKHSQALDLARESVIHAREITNVVEPGVFGELEEPIAMQALGRALMANGRMGVDVNSGLRALECCDRAVQGLGRSIHRWLEPPALLDRAAAFRLAGDVSQATRDANAAKQMCNEDEEPMEQYLTTFHLESVKISLAKQLEKPHLKHVRDARKHIEEAQSLIDTTGYERLRPELNRLVAEVAKLDKR